MPARLRRHLDRVRHGEADQDGFMLIYVLMVTAIIGTLVGATLVLTGGQLIPAVQGSYNQAADVAAQAGLQAFVAYADDKCGVGNADVATCTLTSNYSGTVAIPTPNASAGYSATYSWVATKDPTNRWFRVRSVGTVKQGGITATKTVVGDVVGGASLDLLDFGIVTGFESESSSMVLARWPDRTIALTCAGVNAADFPIKGDKCGSQPNYLNNIHWSGSSPGTAAGKVATCNATYDVKGGRANNLPNGAPNPYVDWTESGLAGNNYTNFQPCQTSWGSQTKLLAPDNPGDGAGGYYSNDALLLSNSYPGGSGPLFNQPVQSMWRYTAASGGQCGTTAGKNYRSLNVLCAGYPVEIGGDPSTASAYKTVQWVSSGPQLPSNNPTIPATACVYAGPTRVVLNGNTATVTSPQTTAAWVTANAATRPAQCYTGAGGQGMAVSTVNLTSPVVIPVVSVNNNGTVPKTTPAIAHGSSGWPVTGQKRGDTASTANSVFYLTNGTAGSSATTATTVAAARGSWTAATGAIPSSSTDGAYLPKWTSFTTGSSCSTSTDLQDLKFFNCYYGGNNNASATYSASSFRTLEDAVTTAVAGNPAAYTTDPAVATNLKNLVQSKVSPGNSTDAAAAAPTSRSNASHRWVAGTPTTGSAAACAQAAGVAGATSTTNTSAPSSEPFFDNTAGRITTADSSDTTCYTVPVSLQVGTCSVLLVAGVCLGSTAWGPGDGLLGLFAAGGSVPQFTVTFAVKKTTTTTTTTVATSTFPTMNDVTQYELGNNGTYGASGPGDLYVEGSVNHTMAVVAANDAVVTGSVNSSATDAAVMVVGQNNTRIYHPVSCAVTDAAAIAATDAGWCPNDITGLYDSVPASGDKPNEQYVNLRPDLTNLTLKGVVLALGNADAHITCPQPPGGGGVCGGDFTTDNLDRGNSLGQLTIVGTLGMAHHAPVGRELDVTDTYGQTSRPWSGYQLAQKYQNLKAIFAATPGVKNVLQTRSTTSTLWRVLSVSSGTGP